MPQNSPRDTPSHEPPQELSTAVKAASEEAGRLPTATVGPGQPQPLWHDPLLLSTLLFVCLLISYELPVTLLQPTWGGAISSWLRAVVAWIVGLLLALLSLWLARTGRSGALGWGFLSASVLTYAFGKTLLVVSAQFIFPSGVPFPWWSDVFYLLTFPFLYLGLILLPAAPGHSEPTLSRVKVILDSLLIMGAAAALLWYFILAPIYLKGPESMLGKATNLAYPIGDLGALCVIIVVLTRRFASQSERMALRILIAGLLFLILGDSLFAALNLYTQYHPGMLPDLFFLIATLLFLLAGLAQFRLAHRELPCQPEARGDLAAGQGIWESGIPGTARLILPFVVALLASGLILIHAARASSSTQAQLMPFAVACGLLILATARQAIATLESEQLRHQREAAQAAELAMREAHQRMDAFLSIASHELKTPLTTLKLHLQLAQRGSQRLKRPDMLLSNQTPRLLELLEGHLSGTEKQANKMSRLISELLDASSIQANKIELHLENVDLAAIVHEAVEEQRQANPSRAILLRLPAEDRTPVLADADRIGQVVTNYLINALKYSPEARPIELCLEQARQQALVTVRDEGEGLSLSEQAQVWDRFYRAPGVKIQSGSGIGLGLGLYICKTIIERHHGTVGVESVPGKGAQFWFTLPLPAEAA